MTLISPKNKKEIFTNFQERLNYSNSLIVEPYFYQCPYCWENISILLDPGIHRQELIEDCEVCCRPIEIEVEVDDEDGSLVSVQGKREDE